MSALGLLLLQRGHAVSASDLNDGPYLRKLQEKGAVIWVGSHPESIPKTAVVFHSSAVRDQDAEKKYCVHNDIPVFPRHELLHYITSLYFTIAIAGCHGKTTTTAWIACVLEQCGYDPTAMVGGTVNSWGSNVRLGNGKMGDKPILIMEADESDGSFLHIHAQIAVITNLDLDHTDLYKDMSELVQAYEKFARQAYANGGLYIPSLEMKDSFQEYLSAQVLTELQKISIKDNVVQYEGLYFSPSLAGIHNLFNASAVLATCLALGISGDTIQQSLNSFTGVGRRLELIKQIKHKEALCDIYDDYGHHPREIQVVLETLELKYNSLVVVWEPHRLTRFTHFYLEFKKILSRYAESKTLFILPIYKAGDKDQDFPDFSEKFTWFLKNGKTISGENDLIGLKNFLDTMLQDTQNIACVFFGAGESTAYCRNFSALY